MSPPFHQETNFLGRANWGWILNGGVSPFVPKCPVVPVCPLLSRFVLVPGPKKDKRGQTGTKRDISGQMGKRLHLGSTPFLALPKNCGQIVYFWDFTISQGVRVCDVLCPIALPKENPRNPCLFLMSLPSHFPSNSFLGDGLGNPFALHGALKRFFGISCRDSTNGAFVKRGVWPVTEFYPS